jgi:AcrR family transcriptional regulator
VVFFIAQKLRAHRHAVSSPPGRAQTVDTAHVLGELARPARISAVSTHDRQRPDRRKPQQERARLTAGSVLDAAVKVLVREGIEALTTNRIAEVAGVSIGSVYQYFPDKHAIFEALRERHADEMRQLVDDTLLAHQTAPLEQLLFALLDAIIDVHARAPELHELLDRQLAQRPDGAHGLRGALREVISSRAHELAPSHDLERVLFVLPNLIDTLAHEAVLGRPAHLSLSAAREEAARSIAVYLRGATSSPAAP